jgi:hypothetical protein
VRAALEAGVTPRCHEEYGTGRTTPVSNPDTEALVRQFIPELASRKPTQD